MIKKLVCFAITIIMLVQFIACKSNIMSGLGESSSNTTNKNDWEYSNMKKIILDTDIGVDCDDAVAIALLLGLQKRNLCQLLGVSTSTARSGATSAVRAILDYYGETDIPCGRMYTPFLPCDHTNNYAQKLMDKYNKPEAEEESVHLIRRLLANATEKVTLVAVGPLTTIAKLLQSEPDELSSLSGMDLVKEKVDTFYTMSGRFIHNFGEWNVVQDIPSARFVFDNMPVNTIVSPGELGDVVYTGSSVAGRENHPVLDSLIGFFEEQENYTPTEVYMRQSWDPLTCYAAVLGMDDFNISEKGDAKIDEFGVSTFTPNENGKFIILNSAKDNGEIAKKIDQLIV